MKIFYFKSYNRSIWHVVQDGKPLCNCYPDIGCVKESLCERILNNDK